MSRLRVKPWIGAGLAALVSLALILAGWSVSRSLIAPAGPFWVSPARLQRIAASPDGLPRQPVAGEAVGSAAGPQQLTLRFNRAAGQPGRLAVWAPLSPAQANLFLNGVKVRPPNVVVGPRTLASTGATPRLWILPTSWMHDGGNRLDLIVGQGGRATLMLGPLAVLDPVQARLSAGLGLAGDWIPRLAGLGALLSLALALIRRQSGWLALAGAAAAAGGWAVAAGVPDGLMAVAGPALLAAAAASLVCAAWTQSGKSAWFSHAPWAASVGLLGPAFLAALAGAVGLRTLWLEAVTDLGLSLWLAALILAAAAFLAVQAWRGLRTGLDLGRIIARQQAQIAETRLALEQEMRRGAILEERQRLARDMHDGIGGQLASLLARVRTGRVSLKQMETELNGGLAELRLLVDSLDAVGDTLGEALASFRSRVRVQAEGAGMTLVWRESGDLDLPATDPRWLLNLYRLLQEAVTNALRHSGGDELTVEIERLADRTIRFVVADNGAGFDPRVATPGRGLGNMEHRAAQLGGSLSLGGNPSGQGARVELAVSLPTAAWAGLQSSGEITPS